VRCTGPTEEVWEGEKKVQTHRKGTPVRESNMGLGGVRKRVEK